MILKLPNLRERARRLFERQPDEQSAGALVETMADDWREGRRDPKQLADDCAAFGRWLNG